MRQIYEEIDHIKEKIILRRRYIHSNPETGFDTQNTEKYVADFLSKLNIHILPSTVGVLGLIKGNETKDIIALRADMDALNLNEENKVEYKSKVQGKMHACGHDGHTAMLMSAAEILNNNKDKLKHDILLIFQPAEEGPNLGGARIMLKDLEDNGFLPKIKCIYGQHVTTELEIGKAFIIGSDNTVDTTRASMGAEDFSYFAQRIPAAFIWVGAKNEERGLVNLMHNPRFDFDEDVLPVGVKLLCRFALQD